MLRTDLIEIAQPLRSSWRLLEDLPLGDMTVVATLSCLLGDDLASDIRGEKLRGLLRELGVEMSDDTFTRLRAKQLLGNAAYTDKLMRQQPAEHWKAVRRAFARFSPADYRHMNAQLAERASRFSSFSFNLDVRAIYLFRSYPSDGRVAIQALLYGDNPVIRDRVLDLLLHEAR